MKASDSITYDLMKASDLITYDLMKASDLKTYTLIPPGPKSGRNSPSLSFLFNLAGVGPTPRQGRLAVSLVTVLRVPPRDRLACPAT